MVYSLAKETKASVHSMLGDTVQLTWNATQPLVLHETKGAVFLARLAKYFEAGAEVEKVKAVDRSKSHDANADTAVPLTLNAAICTGKATVHSITTDMQQALIIEAPWLPALEGCFELSKRVGSSTTSTTTTGCVLMDDRTMKGSHLEVESCAVEMVRFSETQCPVFLGHYVESSMPTSSTLRSPTPQGAESQATTIVHQLLGEHVRADDEWMYQLQSGDGTENGKPVSKSALHLKAVLLASEGQHNAALEALELAATATDSSKAATQVHPSFVKALQAKCLGGL